jgi:hypothetical protein
MKSRHAAAVVFDLRQGAGAAAAGALDGPRPRVGAARNTMAKCSASGAGTAGRLLMDWPRVMGVAPTSASRVPGRPTLSAASKRRQIARERVYAVDPSLWLAEPTLEALDRWSVTAATLPARLLHVA